MQKKSTLFINLIIVVVSALLFIPFIGNVHLFDWDEINFAESAREMIVTGDYLNVRVNFDLFWEKPPLFIWMQVLSMKLFGVNEFAARFPNAFLGIITLVIIFNIGKKHFSPKFGLIWMLAYAGSVLPHIYFKSGIIDPWFNLFIFLGICYFIVYLIAEQRKTLFVILSALFIGLGTLTKGPVALLIFLLSGFVYLLLNRFRMRITFLDILIYILCFIFIGGFWFILQMLSGNLTFLKIL
jgi:4-amino-4-deoxy-L-arabinose transferase-like glycosyltransferase